MTGTRVPFRPRGRATVLAALGLGLALLVAANAHLVIVSFASQPDCVPHVKSATEGAAYRAAKSAC